MIKSAKQVFDRNMNAVKAQRERGKPWPAIRAAIAPALTRELLELGVKDERITEARAKLQAMYEAKTRENELQALSYELVDYREEYQLWQRGEGDWRVRFLHNDEIVEIQCESRAACEEHLEEAWHSEWPTGPLPSEKSLTPAETAS